MTSDAPRPASADATEPGVLERGGQPVRGWLPKVGRLILARNELGVLIALVALVTIIGVFHPNFLSLASISNIGQQSALYGMSALGMVFLLSMREIDLSVGAIYGLTITAAALLMKSGTDPWLAAGFGIAVGLALGGFNGVVANALRIPTIIVTLGTLSVFRGLDLIVTHGQAVSGLPRDHPFFTLVGATPVDIPVSVWVFVVVAIVLSVLYGSTRFGYVVRAIGSNEEAARWGGIPINRIRLATLILVGGLSALSGMVTLAYFQSSDPLLGSGYELQAIAAAVIGGTGLSGGRGSVLGAMLGALLIGVISSGLIQFGVTGDWSIFFTGAVIILAVALDRLIGRRQTAAL
jgi:ribose transport system permease protein